MAVGKAMRATVAAALAAALAGCAQTPDAGPAPRPPFKAEQAAGAGGGPKTEAKAGGAKTGAAKAGAAKTGAAAGARAAGARPAAGSADELRLSFVDMLAPGAFDWTGPAVVVKDGADGLWVVAPGAARAERVRVQVLGPGEGSGGEGSGATTDVALFRGAAGPGGAARLSAAAGEALGLTGPARVRITALRREPRLAGTPPAHAAPEKAAATGPAGLWRRLF